MTLDYYDIRKVMSYNAIYNFIVGARGLGKTYGFKYKSIKDALNGKGQFIYLRRYKSELITAKLTFMVDVQDKFPEHEFQVQGFKLRAREIDREAEREAEAAGKAYKNSNHWEDIGFFAALSTAQSMKSVSFAGVRKVIYDEFIIEKSLMHYLPNEPTVMINFLNTVDRNRDLVKVYFLANSVSIQCPYFLEYGIRPDELPEISTSHKGFICTHFPLSGKFAEQVKATRYGRFISGTDYEKYAVGNEFADAHSSLIAPKPADALFQWNFETKHGIFSFWEGANLSELSKAHRGRPVYFAVDRRVNDGRRMFTLVPEKMDENRVLVTYSDKFVGMYRTAFRQGRIYFDKPQTRNAFIEIFKR